MKQKLRILPVLIHVSVWLLLFALPHLIIDSRTLPKHFFPGSWFTITNIYNIGLFYLNAFVLYPKLFKKTFWWLFIICIGALMGASYYLKLWFTLKGYPDVVIDGWARRILFFPPLVFFAASIIYRMTADRIKSDATQKEIVAEQLAIKLKFLRTQINPHFIFNVLTNLVSLARQESKQLEPALITLSDLMRYMLYENDEKKVLVQQEVDYLKSYISLQKIRFDDSIKIDLDINLPMEILNQKIEPMLLIPFVENAFKHNTGADDPHISVSLSSQKAKLKFEVENNFLEHSQSKDQSSGIGLENVRSRLDLLYPNKHTLAIENNGSVYQVQLILQLTI